MKQVEKFFRVIRYLKDRKVKLSTFLLQKGAEGWWKLTEHRRMSNVEATWKEFKKVFKDKYHSNSYGDAKRNEFFRLV